MNTTDSTAAREGLAEAHERFVAFIEAWEQLVATTDSGSGFARRVRAYQPFSRDQGMGRDPFDWMADAAEELGLRLVWAGDPDYPDKRQLLYVLPADEEVEL